MFRDAVIGIGRVGHIADRPRRHVAAYAIVGGTAMLCFDTQMAGFAALPIIGAGNGTRGVRIVAGAAPEAVGGSA